MEKTKKSRPSKAEGKTTIAEKFADGTQKKVQEVVVRSYGEAVRSSITDVPKDGK